MGCDIFLALAVVDYGRFQSTHPQGVRLMLLLVISVILCFNPRTHMGCDTTSMTNASWRYLVSIHAPTWGATDGVRYFVLSDYVSIHAPTWGATVGDANFGNGSFVSIHAPTWGATQKENQNEHIYKSFNPRTHMGCDCTLIISQPQKN